MALYCRVSQYVDLRLLVGLFFQLSPNNAVIKESAGSLGCLGGFPWDGGVRIVFANRWVCGCVLSSKSCFFD